MVRSVRTLAATILLTAAAIPALAQAPPEAPKLSRQQRAALQAVVRAMDTGAAIEDIEDGAWPVHLLRTSDGAHYVAFSVASAHLQAGRPLVVYVRLATRQDIRATPIAERSLVAEWLAGQLPAPPLNQKGIAFGEMPTYGAGAIAARGPGPQSLQLLELERVRARERREAEERQRKDALEGTGAARGPRPPLPFEDFDLSAVVPRHGRRCSAAAVSRPVPATTTSSWAGPTRKLATARRRCTSCAGGFRFHQRHWATSA